MPKAEYRPNPDPLWCKETMVEDYLDVAAKNGATPSSSDVERLALADLAVHSAVVREAKPMPARAKREPSKAPGQSVQTLAASLDSRVVKRSLAPTKPKPKRFTGFLDKKPATPRQAAAIMRLGQILNPQSYFRPSKEFDYKLPELAKEFAGAMQRLERGTYEFEGKSAIDCERIMWRRIEDICDRSTGSLGFWWVK